MISKSQFLLLRHGISDFNIAHEVFNEKLMTLYPGDDVEAKMNRIKATIEEFSDL